MKYYILPTPASPFFPGIPGGPFKCPASLTGQDVVFSSEDVLIIRKSKVIVHKLRANIQMFIFYDYNSLQTDFI